MRASAALPMAVPTPGAPLSIAEIMLLPPCLPPSATALVSVVPPVPKVVAKSAFAFENNDDQSAPNGGVTGLMSPRVKPPGAIGAPPGIRFFGIASGPTGMTLIGLLGVSTVS